MNMKRICTSSLAFAAAIAAVSLVAACEQPPAPTVFEAALYAVDSLSGDVFGSTRCDCRRCSVLGKLLFDRSELRHGQAAPQPVRAIQDKGVPREVRGVR